jgi:anti-sigma factor RsiW
MNPSKQTVSPDERAMKLMAYADGELEGDELAEVEQWIREDAKSVLFANDLAELGSILKDAHPPTKSFDLADVIMAKVALEPAPAAKPKVVPLSAGRAARNKKRNTFAWVAGGIALAASIFLVTRDKGEAPLAQSTTPLVQPTAAANVAAASTAAAVDVENAGSSVSVFYLPSENTTTTTTTHVMIWVDESGGK